ncbi:tyrosine-type recombinase/integrase [Deinococcus sp. VB343]|uniref:tyrosine-type recombinase/integrase n=1 Tax=Deinococcus sp. VB343 TaxID=3385567 RepID=UPI0039C971D4
MTLARFQADPLAPAQEWIAWPSEERRRRAVEACALRDRETLWSLTLAHQTRRHGVASTQTLRKYRLGMQRWIEFTGSYAIGLLQAEPEHADLWLRRMEAGGLKPMSVGVYLAGARAFYQALRWAKATRLDPFRDVRPQRDKVRPQDKRQPYTEDELEKLLALADADMRVLLLLGASAGLRASEIVNLRWGDINKADAIATVTGKGRKTRRVILSGSLLTALDELVRIAPEQRVIGRSPEAARLRMKALCHQAGVTYKGLHALRHSAGTRLVRAGFALQDIAEHLGHSDVATARIYGKWADDRLRDFLKGQ